MRSQKHLAVTSDAKWNNHIKNILDSVNKYLNILQKLKEQLSRHNLENLHLLSKRLISEYASKVWDNYGMEVGRETLEKRKKRRNLQMIIPLKIYVALRPQNIKVQLNFTFKTDKALINIKQAGKLTSQ